MIPLKISSGRAVFSPIPFPDLRLPAVFVWIGFFFWLFFFTVSTLFKRRRLVSRDIRFNTWKLRYHIGATVSLCMRLYYYACARTYVINIIIFSAKHLLWHLSLSLSHSLSPILVAFETGYPVRSCVYASYAFAAMSYESKRLEADVFISEANYKIS